MASQELPEHLRDHVKRAVSHYARFYAELVGENPQQAEEQLASIRNLDRRVKDGEAASSYQAYFERRSQLMRIFHFQLMKKLEGQVQQELLDEAEKLIDKLEIITE